MNFQNIAQKVINEEAEALRALSASISMNFSEVVDNILSIDEKGRVITVGMGKSGYIAKKIAASLASTGTPALYVHPGEASHGDLGMITKYDIVIMFSASGETKELLDVIGYCKSFEIKTIAVTMKPESMLAKNSNFLLLLPYVSESSSLSAPTTSAVMMLVLGDALTVALHTAKDISKDDYLIFHPGGSIGASLLKNQKS